MGGVSGKGRGGGSTPKPQSTWESWQSQGLPLAPIFRKFAGAKGSRLHDAEWVIPRVKNYLANHPEPRENQVDIPEGGGAALPKSIQRKMEKRLGTDLGDVRVHDGGASAKASDQLNAKAFTKGTDVHFASGQLDPSSQEGEKLLAHELTHVAQNKAGGVQRQAEEEATDDETPDAKSAQGEALEVSDPHEPAEQEADAVANEVVDNDEEEAKPANTLARDVKRKIHRTPATASPAAAPAAPPPGAGAAPAAPSNGPKPPNPATVGAGVTALPPTATQRKPATEPSSPDVAAETAAHPAAGTPKEALTPVTLTPPVPPPPMDAQPILREIAAITAEKADSEALVAKFDQDAALREQSKPEEQKFESSEGKTAPHAGMGGNPGKAAPDPTQPAVPDPPDMSGMAMAVNQNNFLAAAHDVEQNWQGQSVGQRAGKMGTAAQTALTAAEVGPNVTLDPQKLGTGLYGQMHADTWKLVINEDAFADKLDRKTGMGPDGDTMAIVAEAVYHEARHAEQFHKMARVRAGKNSETVDQIAAKMPGFDRRAIVDAHGKKIGGTDQPPASPEFIAWFDSVYAEPGKTNRDKVLRAYYDSLKLGQQLWDDQLASKKDHDDAKKIYEDVEKEVKTQEPKVSPLEEANKKANEAHTKAQEAVTNKKAEIERLRTEGDPKWQRYEKAKTDWTTADQVFFTTLRAAGEKRFAWNSLKEARDTADGTRVEKAGLVGRAYDTFQSATQQYAPLYQAYTDAQANQAATPQQKTDTERAATQFGTATYVPARQAYDDAQKALAEAQKAFDEAEAKLADPGVKELTKADEDFKKAQETFNAAHAERSAAETAYVDVKGRYDKATGELPDLEKKLEEALTAWKGAWTVFEAESKKLKDLRQKLQDAGRDWRVAHAGWKTDWDGYEQFKPKGEKAYNDYRALPEEQDAFKVGGQIGAEYRKRFPPP